VLAGHSWGGLLAQLAARKRPELLAGLVLVDPADERFRASLPPEDRRETDSMGARILGQHARGVLGETTRDRFRPFACRLTADPRLQSLILDAYAACYAERSQAQMIQDENGLFAESIPALRRTRASAALPEIPATILSATTGMPDDQRDSFTGFHADVATEVPGSTHVVLPDAGHLIPQERPERVAEAINLVITELRQARHREPRARTEGRWSGSWPAPLPAARRIGRTLPARRRCS
jgi:pimeloyl-ACP methyl ester carboxylesterase